MQTSKSKEKIIKSALNKWVLRNSSQLLKGSYNIGFKNVFGYLHVIEKSLKIVLEIEYFKEAVLSSFQLGTDSCFYLIFIVRIEAKFLLTDQKDVWVSR